MSRLYGVLDKIVAGVNVFVKDSRVVTMNTTPVLCSAAAPAPGKYLILSRVWITSGSSQTNFVFQNRLTVKGVTTANASDSARPRELAVLNYTAADLNQGDIVSLAMFSPQSGSTNMTGELILIRVGT